MTARRDRYQAEGAEAEFEPGSRGRVMRNLRGIRSMRAMARAESEALLDATNRVINQTHIDQRFKTADICRMHRLWLGNLYAWAGEYRQVNMVKDGFPFAAANQVPSQMQLFERGPSREFTPCRFAGIDDQAMAMGIVQDRKSVG